MDPLILSRWQFAITTIFHFLFVPLSIGLALFIAIAETIYVKTRKDVYLRIAKFWGNLFLVTFGVGVVTGMVLEFQFGLNWAQFSRYVGDIFGPPLAVEAFVAFFLESVFIGLWIYGWNKISPKLHCFAIWMVSIGTMLSAFWILAANAFMQQPAGYALRNGRIEMTDFFAFIGNPMVPLIFWHTFFACVATGAFFVVTVSCYHLNKKSAHIEVFQKSLRLTSIIGLVAVLGVVFFGHLAGQHLNQVQPMKLAASEALWETESPAGEILFAIPDEKNRRNDLEVKIPFLLSFLTYDRFSGEVKGMNQLQKEMEIQYGPDNYIPPVTLLFWSFRVMVFAGLAMLFFLAFILNRTRRNRFDFHPLLLKGLMFALPLPYLANSAGWIVTEVGRQPWLVYGLMKTRDGLTTNLSLGNALSSIILFTLVYGLLSFIAGSLLVRISAAGVKDGDSGKGGY